MSALNNKKDIILANEWSAEHRLNIMLRSCADGLMFSFSITVRTCTVNTQTMRQPLKKERQPHLSELLLTDAASTFSVQDFGSSEKKCSYASVAAGRIWKLQL